MKTLNIYEEDSEKANRCAMKHLHKIGIKNYRIVNVERTDFGHYAIFEKQKR